MRRSRLSERELSRIIEQVIDALPPRCKTWLDNVVVDIEPRPSREMLEEVGLDPDHETLLGLFVGAPVTEQEYGLRAPNRVIIFQRPIEEHCRSLAEVRYEVRKTLIHELAHHFGYSEEDLEDFEAEAGPFGED